MQVFMNGTEMELAAAAAALKSPKDTITNKGRFPLAWLDEDGLLVFHSGVKAPYRKIIRSNFSAAYVNMGNEIKIKSGTVKMLETLMKAGKTETEAKAAVLQMVSNFLKII